MICSKCKKKTYSIYAGRMDDFFKAVLKITEFAEKEGITDMETYYFFSRWIERIKRKLSFEDDLKKLIEEKFREW